MRKTLQLLTMASMLFGTLAPLTVPGHVHGAGGGGGGGSVKPLEVRVTGYITSIDYATGVIHVGTSYYGSASVWVTEATKISIDTINGTVDQLEVGDWAEVRYDWSTKVANKIAATSF